LSIELSTELASIDIPFIDVVLEEVFNILPSTINCSDRRLRPKTIQELAAHCQTSAVEIIAKLNKIRADATNIMIDENDAVPALKKGGYLLNIGAGGISFSHPGVTVLEVGRIDLAAVWPQVCQSAQVVCAARSPAIAFSATMFFRSEGCKQARALNGSL